MSDSQTNPRIDYPPRKGTAGRPAGPIRAAGVVLGLSLAAAFCGTETKADPVLPIAGHCIPADTGGFFPVKAVSWDEQGASVVVDDRIAKAAVAGLRDHSGGFKLSLFYNDPFTGFSEVVLFSVNPGPNVVYRMGMAGYDFMPDGTRVLSIILGFRDARCAFE